MKWIEFSDEIISPTSEHSFWVRNTGSGHVVTLSILNKRDMMLEPTTEILGEHYDTEIEASKRMAEIMRLLNHKVEQ